MKHGIYKTWDGFIVRIDGTSGVTPFGKWYTLGQLLRHAAGLVVVECISSGRILAVEKDLLVYLHGLSWEDDLLEGVI
jgi:hypothetical protein